MNLGKVASRLGVVVCAVVLGVAAVSLAAQAQNYTILHSFQSGSDGLQNPSGGLVRDSAGNFYGNTYDLGGTGLGTVYELTSQGVVTVLQTFKFTSTKGGLPSGPLLREASGNLFGTTEFGGAGATGTVFEVRSDGKENVLYSFGSPPDLGSVPYSGLIRDRAGNLYGTTEGGGTNLEGTVFKVSAADHSVTYLHSFQAGDTDGADPRSGVVLDSAGNLYGTTVAGGTAELGTVYKLDSSGKVTVLHSFAGQHLDDGSYPAAPLLLASDGTLYGMTETGGTHMCIYLNGCGTLFKIDAAGNYTILINFGADRGQLPGTDPGTVLVEGSGGNVYGIAEFGGGGTSCDIAGCGVLFQLTPSGHEKILHVFADDASDGKYPNTLILSGGSLYGTTMKGGDFGYGTLFQYTLK